MIIDTESNKCLLLLEVSRAVDPFGLVLIVDQLFL
jgi:hypothetical protein